MYKFKFCSYFLIVLMALSMGACDGMQLDSVNEAEIQVEKKPVKERVKFKDRLRSALEHKRVKVDGNWITQEQLKAHLDEFLDVTNPNRVQLFRWARPIRYFVDGLQDHPSLNARFDELVQQVAALTKLDIQRHDRIYWPQTGTDYHPDSPDNRYTNAVLLFTENMQATFETEAVVKAYELLKVDLRSEFNMWLENKKKKDHIGISKGLASNKGEIYYHAIADVTLGKQARISDVLTVFVMELLCVDLRSNYSNQISPSITNKGDQARVFNDLNEFDTALIKTYYALSVPLLGNKDNAAELMYWLMWVDFFELGKAE